MAEKASRFRTLLGGAIAVGIVSLTSIAFGQEWPMGGQNLQNSRSQSVTTISPQNVGGLKQNWGGYFYAVDASNGALRWSTWVGHWTGVQDDRDGPAIDGDTLILGDGAGASAKWTATGGLTGSGARVIAVNRLTGALKWSTEVETFPAAFMTGSPVIYKGVVYIGVSSNEESVAITKAYPCCAFRGSVVALDEASGKKLWQTYMAPSGYSGDAVWGSTPIIDAARNAVYVGTGNNYSVPQAVKSCFANNPENPDCAAADDHFDSVVALDLTTGEIKWATRAVYYDASTTACQYYPAGYGNCPNPESPDYDFAGSGPNMLGPDLIGIGQKSGVYWALNPDNGSVVWQTQVGPSSGFGGVEWGTAFDGTRIYVPISNWSYLPYALRPGGAMVTGGSWAVLDPSSGQVIWQTATPGSCSPAVSGYEQGSMAMGSASAANGVVFVGSMDTNPNNPTMLALDAASGEVLWSYIAGSSVNAAPAIASDNSVYWGSGYSAMGAGNNKLFAFSIQ